VGDEDEGKGSNDGAVGDDDSLDRLEGEGEEFARIIEHSEADEAGNDEGSSIDGDMIVSMIRKRSSSTSLSSVSRSSSASHRRLAAFRVRLVGSEKMAGGDGKGDWVEGDDDGTASDEDGR
jgi:hypothetical protein